MSQSRIAILLDEDVWDGLANALRQQGYDVVSVNEVGRKGFSDQDQMVYALSQGRAVLTHNAGDFVGLVKQFYFQEKTHFGVIIAPHLEKGELLRKTLALLEGIYQEELTNTIRFI
jgi:predicted nuclease of predicted toxin-antitoxin system